MQVAENQATEQRATAAATSGREAAAKAEDAAVAARTAMANLRATNETERGRNAALQALLDAQKRGEIKAYCSRLTRACSVHLTYSASANTPPHLLSLHALTPTDPHLINSRKAVQSESCRACSGDWATWARWTRSTTRR